MLLVDEDKLLRNRKLFHFQELLYCFQVFEELTAKFEVIENWVWLKLYLLQQNCKKLLVKLQKLIQAKGEALFSSLFYTKKSFNTKKNLMRQEPLVSN